MTFTARHALGLAAIALLAGCVETTVSDPVPAQMPPAAGGAPFIEGSFSASDAAVAACRSVLASQTTGRVRVVGSEFSQANSAVYMRVGANGAPWRCLVGDDGSNPSVTFVGSEGAL